MRRRGYTPSSIIEFVKTAGVSKADSLVAVELLEHCIRDELNYSATRRMAVIDPVKVVITNYPEDKTEYFEIANNVNDPEAGSRKVEFSRELYIEREDFAAVPPPKFFRLKPEGEVRLMGGYIVKCEDFDIDENGNVTEIRVTADLETGNGNPVDGRKVKGTIHWVSAKSAIEADVRMYDRLFTEANMVTLPEGKEYNDYLNPDSVKEFKNAKLEAALADAGENERFQFVRTGYFIRDSKDANCWNSIVPLKESKTK
jgi:glutaminyl-tRNA synthetase